MFNSGWTYIDVCRVVLFSVDHYPQPPTSFFISWALDVCFGIRHAFTQAKDAFGNNRIKGGDEISVQVVLSSAPGISYRATVVDNEDGTYLAIYTIPRAGLVMAPMACTLGIRHECTE